MAVLHRQLVNNNNIYLPVKADCQKSTSSTMLATLETNNSDCNNRKKTVQQQVQSKCPYKLTVSQTKLKFNHGTNFRSGE